MGGKNGWQEGDIKGQLEKTGALGVHKIKWVAKGGEVLTTGATTPVFLSDTERKKSITVIGNSFNLISRSTSATIVTQITIHGNETGGTLTIPVTVNANT